MYNSNGMQKDDDDRVRRNAPVYDKVPVKHDGLERGPDLPADTEWCPRTQEWWKVWRNSPQAMVMTPTDWELMLETALLHNMLWSPRRNQGAVSVTQLASEVRRRVAAYGASFEDRVKLRMSIETPQSLASEEEEITQAAVKAVDYAERLAEKAAELKEK